MKIIHTGMILTVLMYVVVASIGCSPMGVITCEVLDTIGVDAQIGLADVDDKESYGHVYIIIGGKPYEPRYFGLYLQDNIQYDTPYEVYESADDYVNAGYTVFPAIGTITAAVTEA